MPMWRCPHCGTPQPEAARCWVCRRSSTTCSTCRHFRQSLAASVGYCGLDRSRAPLRGDEHRGCWDPAVAAVPMSAPPPEAPAPESNAVRRLRRQAPARPGMLEGFVPVELAGLGPRTLGPLDVVAPPPPPAVIEAADAWGDRETLFGERDL